MFTSDVSVGWRLQEGRYGNITIGPAGRRVTRSSSMKRSGENGTIFFLGCSTIMGTGLSDEETLPWKLQELMPQYRVENYAVVGHGGCQSKVVLERDLGSKLSGQDIVIYGFWQAHEMRNLAHPFYLWQIASASPSESSFMPWCGVGDDREVVTHPPEEFKLRFSLILKHTSLGRLIGDIYYWNKGRDRLAVMRQVSESIILGMNQYVHNKSGKLIVLLFDGDEEFISHYQDFFRDNKIEYLDGRYPSGEKGVYTIPNDGHPNDRLTSIWSHLIFNYLTHSDTALRPHVVVQ